MEEPVDSLQERIQPRGLNEAQELPCYWMSGAPRHALSYVTIARKKYLRLSSTGLPEHE